MMLPVYQVFEILSTIVMFIGNLNIFIEKSGLLCVQLTGQ